MKKLFILCTILIMLTGCGNKTKKVNELEKDARGLYLINDYFSIYSDEEDPMFIEYSGKTSIKEFLPQSNCLPGCIHNNSEPIDTLNDGGTKIYEYQVEEDQYYFIECHKIGSKYNNGKDILIGKDKEKLINLC